MRKSALKVTLSCIVQKPSSAPLPAVLLNLARTPA